METARDYLSRLIREQAGARFEAVHSRNDLRAVARLLALAAYVEGEPTIGGMFSFLTPSQQSREFPSPEFLGLLAGFAEEPSSDLATFALLLLRAELNAALEAE